MHPTHASADQPQDPNTPAPLGDVAGSLQIIESTPDCSPQPQGAVMDSIKFLERFFEPEEYVELRAFGPRSESLVVEACSAAAIGQFVARNLARIGNTIAFKVNPVQPHLAQQAPREAVPRAGVERITDLYIDIDPQRASGMATAEERALAIERAERVKTRLRENGFCEPIVVDSGNGVHLHYRVDLPLEDEHLTRGILRRLDSEFSDDAVKVDTAVGDAARLARLPGTVNRKGRHTAELPWRTCAVLDAPSQRTLTPRNVLEDFAGEFAQSRTSVPHPTRATTKAPGTANAELIEQRCAFMGHCKDHPGDLGEPMWFTQLSIFGACRDAEMIAHERSSGHPGYDRRQTQSKIERAIENQMPHSCAHIQREHGDEHCHSCQYNGEIKSPIQLGCDRSVTAQRRQPGVHATSGSVPVGETGLGTNRNTTQAAEVAPGERKSADRGEENGVANAHEPIAHHRASAHQLVELEPRRMPESRYEAALLYLAWLRRIHDVTDGTPILVRYREIWFEWNGIHYQRLTDEAACTAFTRWALGMVSVQSHMGVNYVRPYEPSKKWLDDFERMLLTLVPTPDLPRTWLFDGDDTPDPMHIFSCATCLYDVKRQRAIPHTPWFFDISTPSPVALDPDAKAPERYHRFMREIISDQKTIEMVEEFAGLVLTQVTSFHKMLQIIGSPRSGKSTFVELLEDIVGPSNVVAVSPLMLNGSHGTEPLMGKTLGSMGDAETCTKRELAVTVETLKKVSGEDLITVNPKGKTIYSARMPLRFVITANQELAFNDPSGALTKRYLMVETRKSFYGQEDVHLKAELRKEMPGILNVWLNAAHRLFERGRFDEPESSVRLREALSMSSSPITEFVETALVIDPTSAEAKADVHAAYALFSRLRGEYVKGSSQFSIQFKAAVREHGVTDGRPGGGDRRRAWKGIRLSPLWRQALVGNRTDAQNRHLLDQPADAVLEAPGARADLVHLVQWPSASGLEQVDVDIEAEDALRPDPQTDVHVVQVDSESSTESDRSVASPENPPETVDQVDGGQAPHPRCPPRRSRAQP